MQIVHAKIPHPKNTHLPKFWDFLQVWWKWIKIEPTTGVCLAQHGGGSAGNTWFLIGGSLLHARPFPHQYFLLAPIHLFILIFQTAVAVYSVSLLTRVFCVLSIQYSRPTCLNAQVQRRVAWELDPIGNWTADLVVYKKFLQIRYKLQKNIVSPGCNHSLLLQESLTTSPGMPRGWTSCRNYSEQ